MGMEDNDRVSPENEVETLGQAPLFQNLCAADLAHLRELLWRKELPAGTSFITAEQPGDIAYIILEGTVKVFVATAEGDDVILSILGPGEVVGEMSLGDSLDRSASATAMEDCFFLCMDQAAFWHCLRTMPTVSYNLVGILSRRLRAANTQIRALATLDVHGRVARQLLDFARNYGRPETDGSIFIPLRLTQSDLAELVGASRVRVNQVLGTYRRQRYLSINDEFRFTIHDLTALERHCE